MKLKALAAGFAALLTAACLSACSYIGSDPQTLIEPPRATGELYSIQSALKRYVNRPMTMKYPRSGDNRSAFVLSDLDGDGVDEAVAFYTVASETGVAPIHVNVIDKTDGKWVSVADQTTTAADIDRAAFSDIDGDGTAELLIGAQMYNSTEKQLNVYSYERGGSENQKTLALKIQEKYTEFITADLIGSGSNQLLIISLNAADSRASARLYTLSGDVSVELGVAQLDGNVSGYARVQAGTVGADRTGVYIDANKATSAMITDVVFWNGEALVNPFFDVETQENTATLRESTDVCRDVNGDGQVDIPSLTLMPGMQQALRDDRMYLTVWRDFDGQRLTDIYRGDMNYKDGYSFAFPDSWVGSITAVADPGNRVRSYRLWDPVAKTTTEEILSIRAYPEREYSALSEEERAEDLELARKNNLVYVARKGQTAGEYAMTDREIREAFRLIA